MCDPVECVVKCPFAKGKIMIDQCSIEWENKMVDEQMEYDRAMMSQEQAAMAELRNAHDIERVNSLLNEANEEIQSLNKLIKNAKKVAFNSPEINTTSYTHDQVCALSTAVNEIFTILDRGI